MAILPWEKRHPAEQAALTHTIRAPREKRSRSRSGSGGGRATILHRGGADWGGAPGGRRGGLNPLHYNDVSWPLRATGRRSWGSRTQSGPIWAGLSGKLVILPWEECRRSEKLALTQAIRASWERRSRYRSGSGGARATLLGRGGADRGGAAGVAIRCTIMVCVASGRQKWRVFDTFWPEMAAWPERLVKRHRASW